MPREAGDKKSPFPNKETRYACWDARDSYWECLDANGTCDELRKTFEEKCPSVWVKHFDRRKKFLEFQEKMKEGYEPLDDEKQKS